jgi:hypothetical protein
MTPISKSKGTIIILGLTSIFIVCCFLLSLNFSQEAYAEPKKVSGTLKRLPKLATDNIPIPNCDQNLYLRVRQAILSSDDPDWNNAHYFYFGYYDFGKDQNEFSGYGFISHPGGDQTFYKLAAKYTSESGADKAGETEGFIIRGTGKFKDIRARWHIKWKKNMAEGVTGEWSVEYF